MRVQEQEDQRRRRRRDGDIDEDEEDEGERFVIVTVNTATENYFPTAPMEGWSEMMDKGDYAIEVPRLHAANPNAAKNPIEPITILPRRRRRWTSTSKKRIEPVNEDIEIEEVFLRCLDEEEEEEYLVSVIVIVIEIVARSLRIGTIDDDERLRNETFRRCYVMVTSRTSR